jgi:adenylate kinase
VRKSEEMMKLVMFGPPGSGKGTYASRLRSRLGVDVIAMGDIFREIMKQDNVLGRRVKRFVKKGLLVPDDVVMDVLSKRLRTSGSKNGFILDGFPRTVEQAEVLGRLVNLSCIIELIVPDWIIVERLSTRRICRKCGEVYNISYLKPKVEGVCDECSGQLYQRPDDTPEIIEERIEIYERQTHPILRYYKERDVPFVQFKCERLDVPPDLAVEKILGGLRKLRIV